MGSSASKYNPEVTAEQLIQGIPVSVDVKLAKVIWSSRMVLTCTESGREYLVRLPHGVNGVVLFHDGPEKTFPICMVVHNANLMWTRFGIKLPATPREGMEPRTEFMKWSFKKAIHEIYWFELEVGRGSVRTFERFEWRRSHGEEVGSLDLKKWGWKLVRVPEENERSIAKKEDRVDGFSSDGGEVVAVWGNKRGYYDMGHFELRGLALKGEFGESFALMALASCIMIRVNTMRQTVNSNSGGGGC